MSHFRGHLVDICRRRGSADGHLGYVRRDRRGWCRCNVGARAWRVSHGSGKFCDGTESGGCRVQKGERLEDMHLIHVHLVLDPDSGQRGLVGEQRDLVSQDFRVAPATTSISDITDEKDLLYLRLNEHRRQVVEIAKEGGGVRMGQVLLDAFRSKIACHGVEVVYERMVRTIQ